MFITCGPIFWLSKKIKFVTTYHFYFFNQIRTYLFFLIVLIDTSQTPPFYFNKNFYFPNFIALLLPAALIEIICFLFLYKIVLKLCSLLCHTNSRFKKFSFLTVLYYLPCLRKKMRLISSITNALFTLILLGNIYNPLNQAITSD